MLKRIHRAALGGHLYGFATESQLEAFLEEYPLADQPAPIEVTAQQLAEWKATGSWGDDWERGRFIEADSLLRWPLDSQEPKPMTPMIFALAWEEAPAAPTVMPTSRTWLSAVSGATTRNPRSPPSASSCWAASTMQPG